MKVWYVANARLPTEKAHGYQILQMGQAFAEAGAAVELLHPARVNTPALRAVTDVDAYYGLRTPVPRRTLPCSDWLQLVTVTAPFLRGLAPAAFRRQQRTFAAAAAEVLHAVPGDAVIYLRSVDLCELLLERLPAVHAEQMFIELHHLPEDARRLERQLRTLRRVLGIISLTRAMAETLAEHGLPAERIVVAPDGVDWETFAVDASQSGCRERVGIAPGARVAMYVGKFHTMGAEKGIPEILAAARELAPELPDLQFHFVGGPFDRVPAYERQIAAARLPRERFRFLDKQPIQEVPHHLRAADILLMPFPNTHHYAHCMSPLKMFEYMTAGRPIVATHLPSVAEVLTDGQNALLCPCPTTPRPWPLRFAGWSTTRPLDSGWARRPGKTCGNTPGAAGRSGSWPSCASDWVGVAIVPHVKLLRWKGGAGECTPDRPRCIVVRRGQGARRYALPPRALRCSVADPVRVRQPAADRGGGAAGRAARAAAAGPRARGLRGAARAPADVPAGGARGVAGRPGRLAAGPRVDADTVPGWAGRAARRPAARRAAARATALRHVLGGVAAGEPAQPGALPAGAVRAAPGGSRAGGFVAAQAGARGCAGDRAAARARRAGGRDDAGGGGAGAGRSAADVFGWAGRPSRGAFCRAVRVGEKPDAVAGRRAAGVRRAAGDALPARRRRSGAAGGRAAHRGGGTARRGCACGGGLVRDAAGCVHGERCPAVDVEPRGLWPRRRRGVPRRAAGGRHALRRSRGSGRRRCDRPSLPGQRRGWPDTGDAGSAYRSAGRARDGCTGRDADARAFQHRGVDRAIG
jgi:glycosyltransferase involved in cell wall biosynthesis